MGALSLSDVHFASFFSGGFTTMEEINPLEKKLAKRTSACNGVKFFLKNSLFELSIICTKVA